MKLSSGLSALHTRSVFFLKGAVMPISSRQMSFKSFRRKVLEIPGSLLVEKTRITMRINKNVPQHRFLKNAVLAINRLASAQHQSTIS